MPALCGLPLWPPSGLLHERELLPDLFKPLLLGVLCFEQPDLISVPLPSKERLSQTYEELARPQDISECELCSGGQLVFLSRILLHFILLHPSHYPVTIS